MAMKTKYGLRVRSKQYFASYITCPSKHANNKDRNVLIPVWRIILEWFWLFFGNKMMKIRQFYFLIKLKTKVLTKLEIKYEMRNFPSFVFAFYEFSMIFGQLLQTDFRGKKKRLPEEPNQNTIKQNEWN